ncbi:hypothetical protein [Clostridium butyricum]|nr:hypothetical protein [Clostridium butyricum]
MKNDLTLLFILNLFVFIGAIFTPMNLFIKGIIIGGMFLLLIFQCLILKTKRK